LSSNNARQVCPATYTVENHGTVWYLPEAVGDQGYDEAVLLALEQRWRQRSSSSSFGSNGIRVQA